MPCHRQSLTKNRWVQTSASRTWPTITFFSLCTKFRRHLNWPDKFDSIVWTDTTMHASKKGTCMFFVSAFWFFSFASRPHAHIHMHYYILFFAKFPFLSFVDTALLLFSSIVRWRGAHFDLVSFRLSFQQFEVDSTFFYCVWFSFTFIPHIHI